MLNMKVIEVWKPIKGYEWIYEISNFGRVKSLDRFVQYTKDGRFVREWFNVDLAAKKTMIPKEAILKCLNYERKFASGFIFKYEKISNL